MYRQERRSELTSRAIFLILPCYYYKKDEILHDLHLQKVEVIEKRATRMEKEDMRAWMAEESNLLCPEIQEGPSMVILTQGIDLFDRMAKVAKYHNDTSTVREETLSCYSSTDFMSGFRDISYFFPSIIPTLNLLLSQMTVERPIDPILWLADRLRDMSPLTKSNENDDGEVNDKINQ
ncbi:hypothetical protein PRIPAC_82268 [Pristionchus pacificus]|uniref:Uncharacterized protein n=1 Tax=Pristionchus pacificus TaxID=54126 RepID=A0A2A6CAG9_PRIPA|nr:hypothetical protein PRIPAC_82268 [Pristionchus pacificus]|eukprot:PDM75215.1 hypothetical protein PRIPAC_43409 [Pristionchus pacificus]